MHLETTQAHHQIKSHKTCMAGSIEEIFRIEKKDDGSVAKLTLKANPGERAKAKPISYKIIHGGAAMKKNYIAAIKWLNISSIEVVNPSLRNKAGVQRGIFLQDLGESPLPSDVDHQIKVWQLLGVLSGDRIRNQNGDLGVEDIIANAMCHPQMLGEALALRNQWPKEFEALPPALTDKVIALFDTWKNSKTDVHTLMDQLLCKAETLVEAQPFSAPQQEQAVSPAPQEALLETDETPADGAIGQDSSQQAAEHLSNNKVEADTLNPQVEHSKQDLRSSAAWATMLVVSETKKGKQHLVFSLADATRHRGLNAFVLELGYTEKIPSSSGQIWRAAAACMGIQCATKPGRPMDSMDDPRTVSTFKQYPEQVRDAIHSWPIQEHEHLKPQALETLQTSIQRADPIERQVAKTIDSALTTPAAPSQSPSVDHAPEKSSFNPEAMALLEQARVATLMARSILEKELLELQALQEQTALRLVGVKSQLHIAEQLLLLSEHQAA